MKKESKVMKRSVILALGVMLVSLLVGCGDELEEVPTPPTSEVISEVVSEEVSEPASEEPSEVVSEEVSETTDIDISQYTEANGKIIIDLIEDMDYNEFKIIVWRNDIGAEAILSDGDSYQIQEENYSLALYFPNTMTDIQYNEYVVYVLLEREDAYAYDIINDGENQEVTFTGTDVDGKEHEITVYITKE